MSPIARANAADTRPCAICDGVVKRHLWSQSFSSVGDGLLEGYAVVTCPRCGFCFADGLPDQVAFDRYYEVMSKYEYNEQGGRESDYDLAKFRQVVAFLKPHLRTKDERILEVGCATGGLLNIIKAQGYDNVMGVDPSPSCSRAAEALYGVSVQTGTLSQMDVEVGSKDMLVLGGVLEHVKDLKTALQRLSGLLAEGGRVLIAVPDASRFTEGEDAPFQEFSVEHINYFGPKSLTNLLARYGFECLALEQIMMAVSHRTTTPVILAMFQKGSQGGGQKGWVHDTVTPAALESYIDGSKNANQEIERKISALVQERTPVVVWGAGAHTLRLLETSCLSEARIIAYIDSNARFHGKNLKGIPILAPEALRELSAPILISSRVYQHEIAERIRKDMGLLNPIIELYAI